MISNERQFTALTWPKLSIAVLMGLTAGFVAIRSGRMLRQRWAETADTPTRTGNRSDKVAVQTVKERAEPPQAVVSILQATYYTLGVMAANRKPVFFASIVRRVHAAQRASKDRDPLAPVVIRTALERLVAHNKVHLGRRGIVITDSGVKLFARVARVYERLAPKHAHDRSLQSDEVRAVESDDADRALLTTALHE